MKYALTEAYLISEIPLMLGDGMRLFIGEMDRIHLKAKPAKYFESGLVQLRYARA